jgi:hypothetical protein
MGIGSNPPKIPLRTIRSFEKLLPNEIQSPSPTRERMTGLVRDRIGVSCLDCGVTGVIQTSHMDRKILGEFIEDGDGDKHDGHCDDEDLLSEM